MQLSLYHTITRAVFLLVLGFIIYGAVFYLLFSLKLPFAIISAVLAVISVFAVYKFAPQTFLIPKDKGKEPKTLTMLINDIVVAGCLPLIYYLWKHAGEAAIQTPWAAVSPKFFILFFIVMLLVFYLSLENNLYQITISAVLLVVFSIAIILSPYGFGFDTHVHLATEKTISSEGSIAPKHLYYSGQYALVIILQKIFGNSQALLKIINNFLVALAAAFFIPIFADTKKSGMGALFLLLTPLLAIFTVTNPQSLSYVLFLALAFLIFYKNKNDTLLIPPVALAIFFVHPLTGIPAVLFALFSFAKKRWQKNILGVLLALAVPMAFIINGVEFSLPNFSAFISQMPDITRLTHNYFSFNLNAVYGLQLLLWPLFILGAFFGFKHTEQKPNAYFSILMLVSALILFIFIRHPFVINYEQHFFSTRLLILSALAAAPYFSRTVWQIIETLKQEKIIQQIAALIILPLISVTVLYLSYPRVDRAVSTHAYSTRFTDLITVEIINKFAGDTPYIALANQQVSAAALDIFGFKHKKVKTHFNTSEGETYFYPIPTGGKLYSYYLKMVNEYPSRKTALEAMDFMGVDKLYFVVNDYWWRSKDLQQMARKEANSEIAIDKGKNVVFVFERMQLRTTN